MSRVTFTETGATSHRSANSPVMLTSDEAGCVGGGESMFQALIEWREQNPWLDESMANHGMSWNGEVYVAGVMTFEKQGIEPSLPDRTGR